MARALTSVLSPPSQGRLGLAARPWGLWLSVVYDSARRGYWEPLCGVDIIVKRRVSIFVPRALYKGVEIVRSKDGSYVKRPASVISEA